MRSPRRSAHEDRWACANPSARLPTTRPRTFAEAEAAPKVAIGRERRRPSRRRALPGAARPGCAASWVLARGRRCRAAVLLRVARRDTGDERASVLLVEDPVAVGVVF